MTHIQPYPVFNDERPTGICSAKLLDLERAAAVDAWCREYVGEDFRVERKLSYRGTTLYEVWRPGTDVRYKLLVESKS